MTSTFTINIMINKISMKDEVKCILVGYEDFGKQIKLHSMKKPHFENNLQLKYS